MDRTGAGNSPLPGGPRDMGNGFQSVDKGLVSPGVTPEGAHAHGVRAAQHCYALQEAQVGGRWFDWVAGR